MRRLALFVMAVAFAAPAAAQQDPKQGDDTEKRIERLEREQGLDRIKFTGDFRFEAHSIQATVPEHYDGMALQSGLVNTLFYFGAIGQPPASPADVASLIRNRYADYLYFTQNLTFDQLKNAMGQFPPAVQQQLMQSLLPGAHVNEYSADNRILYTNRLRLQMDAKVADNVTFAGRLAMYKVWGDSTGVQVFNGQASSLNIDGTTATVPNSDILRVERAYFSWNKIGGTPLYVSIGRRPSTGGPPLNLRQDEPRGGTPMGSIINYQFDGITVGGHLAEHSVLRFCYGLGYESGFGNGQLLSLPQDRLKDAHFAGLNWDVWDDERTFVQATVARAFNVTDGFNGLVVLPNNPVTGQAIGAPLVMRFTPSTNVGDLDLVGLLLQRRDGNVDWFVNWNLNHSSPEPVTTPFGGFFSDPFEIPTSQIGQMVFVGARVNANDGRTKVGIEFNRGSKYWMNFAPAEDDIVAPKTAARGKVVEGYVTHRIAPRFIAKVDVSRYWYDYSMSGWQLGTPRRLDETPVLGFPTYRDATRLSFSLIARF
ncbi:MAG TPA: DUF3373 family protein [Vicinamibacterales bacterium]|nr:DUF3373 family protein [Vicinamibacterales bacterium]